MVLVDCAAMAVVIGTPLLVLRKLNCMSMTNKNIRGGYIHVVKVDEADNGPTCRSVNLAAVS